MCLNINDVETLFETKLDDKISPIKSDMADIKKAVVSIVEIQKEQVKLEGQVIHLQETQKDNKIGLNSAFDEIRAIQTDSEPKPNCLTMFNNFDRTIVSNAQRLDSHDKTIKDRTWQMLFAFISLGLTMFAGVFVTVFGGLFLYLSKGSI
jgi:hypothetical protein